VIVVAEGAEEGLINPAERFTKEEKKDGSGNIKLDDIGEALKVGIVGAMKTSYKLSVTLKYVDPTYSIRSVPANAADTVMCAKLGNNAVHGAMAGYTAFSTGIVRNAVCWIPIKTINQAGINKISIYDRTWQRLLASIEQRTMVNEEFKQLAMDKIRSEEAKTQESFS
jgi:6-phosphofructokinase 1